MVKGRLHVVLLRAFGLPDELLLGEQDPYVRVSVAGGATGATLPVRRGGTCPCWGLVHHNAHVTLDVTLTVSTTGPVDTADAVGAPDMRYSMLVELAIMGARSLQRDDNLGFVHVQLASSVAHSVDHGGSLGTARPVWRTLSRGGSLLATVWCDVLASPPSTLPVAATAAAPVDEDAGTVAHAAGTLGVLVLRCERGGEPMSDASAGANPDGEYHVRVRLLPSGVMRRCKLPAAAAPSGHRWTRSTADALFFPLGAGGFGGVAMPAAESCTVNCRNTATALSLELYRAAPALSLSTDIFLGGACHALPHDLAATLAPPTACLTGSSAGSALPLRLRLSGTPVRDLVVVLSFLAPQPVPTLPPAPPAPRPAYTHGRLAIGVIAGHSIAALASSSSTGASTARDTRAYVVARLLPLASAVVLRAADGEDAASAAAAGADVEARGPVATRGSGTNPRWVSTCSTVSPERSGRRPSSSSSSSSSSSFGDGGGGSGCSDCTTPPVLYLPLGSRASLPAVALRLEVWSDSVLFFDRCVAAAQVPLPQDRTSLRDVLAMVSLDTGGFLECAACWEAGEFGAGAAAEVAVVAGAAEAPSVTPPRRMSAFTAPPSRYRPRGEGAMDGGGTRLRHTAVGLAAVSGSGAGVRRSSAMAHAAAAAATNAAAQRRSTCMKSPPDALAALRAATSPSTAAHSSELPSSFVAAGVDAGPVLGPPASDGILAVRLLHAQGLAAGACSSEGVYVLGHLLPAPASADCEELGGGVRSAPATMLGGALVWDRSAHGTAAAVAGGGGSGTGEWNACELCFDLRRNRVLQRDEVASILLEVWDRRVLLSDALIGTFAVSLTSLARSLATALQVLTSFPHLVLPSRSLSVFMLQDRSSSGSPTSRQRRH